MTKKFLTLLAVSALSVGVAACTHHHDSNDLPPGKYETETSSVNSYGTQIDKKTTADVTVDKYGNKKTVVESETSRDPEGLFNKSTTTKTTTSTK